MCSLIIILQDDKDEYNENRRSDGKWGGSRSLLNGSYSDHQSNNGTYLLTRENLFEKSSECFGILDWICRYMMMNISSVAMFHFHSVVLIGSHVTPPSFPFMKSFHHSASPLC
jgi:hypothetical protein